jgi:histidyl-tRNA synthetase
VLRSAEQLLRSYDVPPSALDEIRVVASLLEDHELRDVQITLAPGMARGIAYYSGLIFELYAEAQEQTDGLGSELQICGGGRYDGLPLALTGRHSFPALGFAFGLERLLHCVPQGAASGESSRTIAVVVDQPALRSWGFRVAAAARSRGFAVIVHTVAPDGGRHRDRIKRAGYSAIIRIPSEAPVAGAPPEGPGMDIDVLDASLPTNAVTELRAAALEAVQACSGMDTTATMAGGRP